MASRKRDCVRLLPGEVPRTELVTPTVAETLESATTPGGKVMSLFRDMVSFCRTTRTLVRLIRTSSNWYKAENPAKNFAKRWGAWQYTRRPSRIRGSTRTGIVKKRMVTINIGVSVSSQPCSAVISVTEISAGILSALTLNTKISAEESTL